MSLDNTSTYIQAKTCRWTPTNALLLFPCCRLSWTFCCWAPHSREGAKAREKFRLPFLRYTWSSIYYPYFNAHHFIVVWIKNGLGFNPYSIAFGWIAELIAETLCM